jgi:lipopolysaccharide biosynthesis protein
VNIVEKMKNKFWENSFMTDSMKEKIFYNIKRIVQHEGGTIKNVNDIRLLNLYRKQVLNIPNDKDNEFYKELVSKPVELQSKDPKIIAYYLPQMHPTLDNDRWWGKGTTEWTNVSKTVPQYLGHYQPRLPGELGYYDLRISENIARQTELARIYGVSAFCWYYYWFDGKRLLENPLDMYLSKKEMGFPFCLCWANEDWTKSFSGSSREILIKQNKSEESYRLVVHDLMKYLLDERYYTVKNKKLLVIYKPQSIPNPKVVTDYWRECCKESGVGELYIIGCWTSNMTPYAVIDGFDAMAEFQPGSIMEYCNSINDNLEFVNENYCGKVYSYKYVVDNEIYKINFDKKSLYNAVMPMWDNTPRRNNKGGIIFDGASPTLYKKWMKEVFKHNKNRSDLEDDIVFINAWNEWGEGTYMEPDRRYGYAYLQALREAITENR